MSAITDAIKKHHAELLTTISKGAQGPVSRQSVEPTQLQQFVAFLKDELLPHAQGEEAHLYPAVDPLVCAHGRATATMSVDHEFIGAYIDELASAADALPQANDTQRAALAEKVARLSIGLEALFKVHLAKEERVFLPLFEKYLPVAEQQRVLDAMHEA